MIQIFFNPSLHSKGVTNIYESNTFFPPYLKIPVIAITMIQETINTFTVNETTNDISQDYTGLGIIIFGAVVYKNICYTNMVRT